MQVSRIICSTDLSQLKATKKVQISFSLLLLKTVRQDFRRQLNWLIFDFSKLAGMLFVLGNITHRVTYMYKCMLFMQIRHIYFFTQMLFVNVMTVDLECTTLKRTKKNGCLVC